MDRMTLFIQENLNGYNLPSHTLSEIRGVLFKRFGAKFSEGLSPEGRLAMEQAAKREVESAKSLHSMKEGTCKQNSNKKVTNGQRGKKTKTITFTDTYDKTSVRKLDGDITDKTFNKMDLPKRAIGGKIANAFETVETVVHCEVETSQNTADVDSTELQSVEKCLVWMEVHNEAPTPSIPGSEYSRNSLLAENDNEQL
ncbi:uncharacterized protein LOC123523336 [Mercenaria mercenaria]|uniref:uncharacterized protein LOC123523336 n=1 Tax=Mercenaria mercenaria TaxID=6596 RepID=UPI00234EEF7B|nr:uncharacterized protein LOC123523336 [Mercenaria mercenaria]